MKGGFTLDSAGEDLVPPVPEPVSPPSGNLGLCALSDFCVCSALCSFDSGEAHTRYVLSLCSSKRPRRVAIEFWLAS
jgi:hypothetical protein